MTRSTLRIKALGVCALAFSLMAVWAAVAPAEGTAGSWTFINSSGVLKTFEGVLAEPEVGEEVDTTRILHSEVLEGNKILYECKAFSAAAGSKLKANGVMLGKITFTECKAFLGGVESIPCKPKEGKVTTNLIKGQMSGIGILVAEAETAGGAPTNFAFIESTASCALGIKVPIGGQFAIELSNPTTHEVKHLFKESAALTHLWILTNTAEHKASLLGSGWLFLTGAHAGLKFAGLWN